MLTALQRNESSKDRQINRASVAAALSDIDNNSGNGY